MILQRWGIPDFLVADKFRLPELLDSIKGACHAEERRTWWSDAAFDIRALRQLALDGPLSLSPDAVGLLEASLEASEVENDTSGNVRMKKQGSNNASRDDVAFAFVLAAGAWKRTYMSTPAEVTFHF